MSDLLATHMDMLDNASQMLFDDFPNRMTETCIWASARIRDLEAQLAQRDAALETADLVMNRVVKDATYLSMSQETRNAIIAYAKLRNDA